MHQILLGVAVGILAGFASGFLGVSPGGILVPVTVLLTGCEQHMAQGVSLFCQIAPTSLSGVRSYRTNGGSLPMRHTAVIAAVFTAGSVAGAWMSGATSAAALQWTYVAYLMLLEVILIAANRSKTAGIEAGREPSWLALAVVGGIAGLSSGFMGIGGGLAIVVGLTGALRMSQHRAQAASLTVAALPLTAPAAATYWAQGWAIPWTLVFAVIVGLIAGNGMGARLANKIGAKRLRLSLAILILGFAVYMAGKALHLL